LANGMAGLRDDVHPAPVCGHGASKALAHPTPDRVKIVSLTLNIPGG